MTIYLIVIFNIIKHISLRGNHILVSLFALELGANAFGVGILISMYSFFPILLAVYAGKTSDRFGARIPMLFGSLGLAFCLMLPYLFPRLPTLYFTAPINGLSETLYHVSYLNLIGYIGDAEQRKRNFGINSIGGATAGFFAPLITGFLIDNLGYVYTYLCLFLNAILSGFVLFYLSRKIIPVKKESKVHHTKSMIDLIKNESLRRVLITSAIVIVGVIGYNFYLPVYCHSIAMSASSIGIILSAYSAASFVVRIILSLMYKQYSEEIVLTLSLLLAGLTFFIFPFFKNVSVLFLISFVLGACLGWGQPLTTVMAYNKAPKGRSGEALGMRITANRIARLAVPLLFGFVGASFGSVTVFWTGTFFLICGGCITMYKEKLKVLPNKKA